VDLRRLPARVDPATAIAAVGSEPELVDRIRAEITSAGPITVARFMERALYEPGLGYYRRPGARPGREGDFLTAPETHPIFGHAVARFVAAVWHVLDRPSTFAIREHGAGEGALATAILDGLAADEPDLLDAIRYQVVEVEPARVVAFTQRLAARGHASRLDHPAVIGGEAGTPDKPIVGLVLANEVLDALPTHRVRGGDKGLRELFVDWNGERFVEVEGPPSTPDLEARLRDDGVELRDRQLAEISLAADAWVKDAAASLERGVLLLIDYGHPAPTLYGPRRMAGSLLAYIGHRVHDDPLVNVGRQDLTAHVDLTALERVAATAGLVHLGTTTQARFLMSLGAEELLQRAQRDATAAEELLELRSGIVRLLDPRATGAFAVVAFGRDVPSDRALRGLD
jgi:SAM-dependent MidA family methyltransferase